jgi:DNA-binding transcriptional ArsR family regulator
VRIVDGDTGRELRSVSLCLTPGELETLRGACEGYSPTPPEYAAVFGGGWGGEAIRASNGRELAIEVPHDPAEALGGPNLPAPELPEPAISHSPPEPIDVELAPGSADENLQRTVLRLVAEGLDPDELHARLGLPWPVVAQALSALRERGWIEDRPLHIGGFFTLERRGWDLTDSGRAALEAT